MSARFAYRLEQLTLRLFVQHVQTQLLVVATIETFWVTILVGSSVIDIRSQVCLLSYL